MSLVKRIARYVLREEIAAGIAAARYQAVCDEDKNVAGVLDALARLYRSPSGRLHLRTTDSLDDWESNRKR